MFPSTNNIEIIAAVINSKGEVMPGPCQEKIAGVHQEPVSGNTIVRFHHAFKEPPVVVAKQYSGDDTDLASKGINARANVSVTALTCDTVKFKTGDGKGGSELRPFAFTAVGVLATGSASQVELVFSEDTDCLNSTTHDHYHAIALVSQTKQLKNWTLQVTAAALQKQVRRDFKPAWQHDAIVQAFDWLEDVPQGYWPIVVKDDVGYPGALGLHLDKKGKPFGLVQYSNRWSITASHEILEALANPMQNRLYRAQSILKDQGAVDYLVEVCDPCQGDDYAYEINGVWVSDFYTPDYFSDARASSRYRYSQTGRIKAPKSVLKGGSLNWIDPNTQQWWQQSWFRSSDKPVIENLGELSFEYDETVKAIINTLAMRQRGATTSITGLPEDHPKVKEQRLLFDEINLQNVNQAIEWQDFINNTLTKAQSES